MTAAFPRVEPAGRRGALREPRRVQDQRCGPSTPDVPSLPPTPSESDAPRSTRRWPFAREHDRLGRPPACATDWERAARKLKQSRLLCLRAGWLADQGAPPTSWRPRCARPSPAQVGQEVTSLGMELLGTVGARGDHLIEKLYRDVKAMDIVEGTGQIQRLIMARKLVGTSPLRARHVPPRRCKNRSESMKFGIHLPQSGPAAIGLGHSGCREARGGSRVLRTCGSAITWRCPKDAPYPPSSYILEPLIALTWAAAVDTSAWVSARPFSSCPCALPCCSRRCSARSTS